MTESEPADDIMAGIARALELGRSGQPEQARDALVALWDRVGATGDALHRTAIAHYLADLQDATEDELDWDLRALAAIDGLTDDRVRRHHDALRVRAFLPSLHLNLADDYHRLGRTDLAVRHLEQARDLVEVLPDDDYGAMIRGGITALADKLNLTSADPE